MVLYVLSFSSCRRTTGPIRRAKGGWTPKEVRYFYFINIVKNSWLATCYSFIFCGYINFCLQLLQDETLRTAVATYKGKNWKRIGRPLSTVLTKNF